MSRKPHICHILYGFSPGGAEVRTTIFMNALGADYRHTVITSADAFGCLDLLSPDVEIDTICLEGRSFLPLRIRSLLRKLDPDLTCTYNWGGIDGGIAATLARIRPWISILDGFGAEEATGELWRRKVTRRLIYRRADVVVVVSRDLERLARESWRVEPPRVLRIPNGIDTAFFCPGSSDEIRAALGVAPDELLVGTIAHVRPEKDPVRLLNAFACVAGDFPKAKLVFVGGAPHDGLWDALQARIAETGLKDRVQFAGRVDNPREYYRALDVFALTSRTEQMPMSVAEAMACGKPVISTDVGEVRRMVAPANREFVVPVADEDAYVRGLIRLLAEKETRRALGDANRQVALRELDREAMVADYRSLFDRLIHPERLPKDDGCAAGETFWERLSCRVTSGMRRTVSAVFFYTGILEVVSWFRRRFRNERAVILSFHCVSDSSRPEKRYFRNGMNIDSHQFRSLLLNLRRRYRLVPFEEAVEELQLPKPYRKAPVAITFDDGYRSVFDIAFPILQELGVPATVFLPTAYIGSGRLLWWDRVYHLVESAPERVLALLDEGIPLDAVDRASRAVTHMKYMAPADREALLDLMREAAGDIPDPPRPTMMNWDQIRTLHAAGIRFGSHTVTHAYLDMLGREALREELRGARATIERELGVAPDVIAYPDGRFNDLVIEETRAAGYRCAVSTMTGMNAVRCDPFALRRQDGRMSVAGQVRRPSFPVMWAELLGVWDVLYFRSRRTPERFAPYRTVVKG